MAIFNVVLAIYIAFSAASAIANPERFEHSETLAIEGTGEETFYQIDHQLDCGGRASPTLPGLVGTVHLGGGKAIWFDLFQGKSRTLVSLGRPRQATTLTVDIWNRRGQDCRVAQFTTQIVKVDVSQANLEQNIHATALLHSPYIVIRKDQSMNRNTDVPLELVYHVERDAAKKTITIRYTTFFSDENSKTAASDSEGQMSRYGRTSDIEWTYEVIFDQVSGKKLDARYQGGFTDKVRGWNPLNWQLSGDHSSHSFNGEYADGTDHPVLYNIADNNVFSDRAGGESLTNARVTYRLGLAEQSNVPSPLARERFQQSPAGQYMYLVCDKECELENKAAGTAEDYLYIAVRGKLSPSGTLFNARNGAFKIKTYLFDVWVNAQDDGVVHDRKFQLDRTIESNRSCDRMGEDMHGQESTPAIRIGKADLDAVASGKKMIYLRFTDARFAGTTEKFAVDELSVFRMVWNPEMGSYEKQPWKIAGGTLDGFRSGLVVSPAR
ncbi:MAG: hypothetical protein AB7P04_00620 [Bacteriovoracia bacterium]